MRRRMAEADNEAAASLAERLGGDKERRFKDRAATR